MPLTLTVDLNDGHAHALDASPVPFEADGSFDVEIVNHGAGSHVHVHTDEALSRVARPESGNYYVPPESRERITVAVGEPGPRPVEGTLRIAAGYGAERLEIPVRIVERETPNTVDVDESLGEVTTPDPDEEGPDLRAFVPAAVAVVGLALAVLAVLLLNEVVGVVVGALALCCGVAAWYALR
ncbi:hypothetical protein J2752_002510 [Halarchaeum rubridurum]|uniref:Uncharacterized protein n=1 Tax=Halarchaeum rubridurum TaxID=489911 RepID=A0A830G3N2_9EURY|nr:hypothetical protein [Halarchaeum rubridurum]MBP1955587.1 hypothetical protein [Halarchaeum rubridurum]GGM73551.1 hypothetical protein GCM10009017_24360 [Halarchaeum rubridurum]